MTDEAVIELVLNGNTHIFSVLVDRYKDRVFSMVYRFTGDYTEAQDISQEVFLNVFKNLHKFNNKARFSTWLYRINYNLCVDWYRKKKRKGATVSTGDELYEISDNDHDPAESIVYRQRQEALRNAINLLDEKYRTVLVLFYYQGLSYEDIGGVLKLPVKTVETRLYRGRNILKSILAKKRYGGEFYDMQTGNESY